MARKRYLLLGGVVVVALVAAVTGIPAAFLESEDASPEPSPTRARPPSPTPSARPGDPLLIDVSYVTKRAAFSWLHESALRSDTLDRLNRAVESAGGLRSDGAAAAMRKAGAVEAVSSTVEVELEGNHDRQVRITGVHAKREKCSEPLDGTLFFASPQGSYDKVHLGFDLDRPNPRGQYVKPDPNDGRPRFHGDYFADHTYTVRRHEQVTFQFTARTYEQSCAYRYVLELIVDGESRTMTVDDDGEPFRVSAMVWEGGDRRAPPDCGAYDRHYFSRIAGDDLDAPHWIHPRAARWSCE